MSLSVEFNGTTVEFDESDVTETLNEIDCYDSEVVVEGYDSDGNLRSDYESVLVDLKDAFLHSGALNKIFKNSI